jgi:hypothetical protein
LAVIAGIVHRNSSARIRIWYAPYKISPITDQ